jgi:hypothetical protein
LSCLEPFNDESGILFDGWLDNTFGYSVDEKKKAEIIPYKESWVGFIHSSVSLCPFMNGYATIDTIIRSPEFIASLGSCKGIFTLSEYLAAYVRDKLPPEIKVVSLKHPTEFSSVKFDIDRFLAERKVVHIGGWLRKITSFLRLKGGSVKKILLLSHGTLRSLREEMIFYRDVQWDLSGIDARPRLSDQDYDDLLGESIVFIHLCDSSATNTIIECIVRNTPILVNHSAPVAEYLGSDYPFYYSCIEEADEKLQNEGLIRSTHEYLLNFSGKEELTGHHFLHTFENSCIMRELPK